jgi:hypothetical protein
LTRTLAILFLAACLGPLAGEVCAQNIICWTDDNGRRICGDRMPADQVRHDREILNERGVVIRQEQGELTESERATIAAEERAREQRAREAEERIRYGQALLDSYTSVSAIEAVRDRMVAQIDSQIVVIETYLDSLHDKLESLHKTSQRYAPHSDRENAPPMPEVLTRDIDATNSSIEMFQRRLEESHKNREVTRESFEQDISVFRELHPADG